MITRGYARMFNNTKYALCRMCNLWVSQVGSWVFLTNFQGHQLARDHIFLNCAFDVQGWNLWVAGRSLRLIRRTMVYSSFFLNSEEAFKIRKLYIRKQRKYSPFYPYVIYFQCTGVLARTQHERK